MSPARARRSTELDDAAHAGEVLAMDLLTQRRIWLTHDNERLTIEGMSPQHALSAFRKLIEHAYEDRLGSISPAQVVVSELGLALRMQALGEYAIDAELAALKKREEPPRRALRISQVLSAVEDLEDEIAGSEDVGKYTGSVDYAVRLTQLINERLR